ncbi:MAG: amidohydrolase family protein [bacterium]
MAALLLLVAAIAAAQPQPSSLVIRNGTLIDGTGRPPVPGATVFISGDRITRIATGELAIPAGARVIDATSLTILPGLIDMHIHHRVWMWPIFLRFGITTVRDVGSDPEIILNMRELERRGQLTAPRIFACGPLLDGTPPVWGTNWRGSVGLTSADEARAVARQLIDRGVDCLKVYSRLPAPLLRAVVEIASARGVLVTGHLGVVPARDAVEVGVQALEHTSGIQLPMSSAVQQSLVRFFVEKRIFIVPTVLVEENIGELPVIGNADYPYLDLVPPDEAHRWLSWRTDFRFQGMREEHFASWKERVAAKAAFIRAFHRAGGRVVAGSDTPNPFVIPGLSLHRELESLVAAGLSPMDAIMSATSVAAALLRRTDLGTIGEGKLSDVILVEGNPASDIAATRNVRMVIKGGTVVHDWR